MWLSSWITPDAVVSMLVVGALFVAAGAASTSWGLVTWRRKPITRDQMNAAVKRLEDAGLVEGEVGNERQVRQLRLTLAPTEVIAHRGDWWRGAGAASSVIGSALVLLATCAQIAATLSGES